MEVFFFLVSGSVCLCGAAGHGVGRDFLGADHRLLPVQLQLVARALASQLPGERLDALGRHHQGVDTGQWLLWRLEDELKLCHTSSCLAVWSQVCRKEESSLPSVWTVPYLPRSRSHLVWILFTHLYHFYTEKKQEITQHALFIETCLSSAVDIFFCLHCEIWRTAACDHWMWKDCSSTITLKNTLPVRFSEGRGADRSARTSCSGLVQQIVSSSGCVHIRRVSFSELWSLFFLILLNVFRQETGSLAHRHLEVQTFQLLLYEKYNNLFCWDARRVCAFVLGFTRLWLVRQHHVFIVCLGNAIG